MKKSKKDAGNGSPTHDVDWVHECVLRNLFGFTTDQLQKYRANGLMLEGVHYRRNPAKRIVYSISTINSWMSGELI